MRDFTNPVKGMAININEFPDEIIAGKTMGDGYAVLLTGNEILAPFDGRIRVAYPTGHAVCLEGNDGLQVMIHVGVDTYAIQGLNKIHKKAGKLIKKGTKLITTDVEELYKRTGNTATAIVFLSGERIALLKEKKAVDYLENDVIRIEEE